MDGIIFFLHLLGCDTMSHSYKLQSRSTAYIFRTDHGITDWGLHGSGSTDETETSLIAWGAGVNSTGARYDEAVGII
ncbi:PREDICTED: GPI ethanolamine phosphate transferase 1-like isoform X2 [Polistes canadensis]|uniref:GPI ethanolamine phosphate transferase 1-like isoform X2 n=1 Tax=Polistes canadensis TaxID=91411 RepID=UPI000718E5A8|nr:PREDICTED: GPI ethanolamine phosphate transferase 1-like isoform X2 [Polistes canadensis]